MENTHYFAEPGSDNQLNTSLAGAILDATANAEAAAGNTTTGTDAPKAENTRTSTGVNAASAEKRGAEGAPCPISEAPADAPAAASAGASPIFKLSDDDILRIAEAIAKATMPKGGEASAESRPTILAHIRSSFWDK